MVLIITIEASSEDGARERADDLADGLANTEESLVSAIGVFTGAGRDNDGRRFIYVA
jgi:hypothetical protein